MSWSRNDTIELLGLYGTKANLYNIYFSDYYNIEMRMETLNQICNELKVNKPDVTISQIQKRMKSLRRKYSHQLNLIEKAKEQGKEYEPTLWCFENLKFFNSNLCSRSRYLARKNSQALMSMKRPREDDDYIEVPDNSVKKPRNSESTSSQDEMESFSVAALEGMKYSHETYSDVDEAADPNLRKMFKRLISSFPDPEVRAPYIALLQVCIKHGLLRSKWINKKRPNPVSPGLTSDSDSYCTTKSGSTTSNDFDSIAQSIFNVYGNVLQVDENADVEIELSQFVHVNYSPYTSPNENERATDSERIEETEYSDNASSTTSTSTNTASTNWSEIIPYIDTENGYGYPSPSGQ